MITQSSVFNIIKEQYHIKMSNSPTSPRRGVVYKSKYYLQIRKEMSKSNVPSTKTKVASEWTHGLKNEHHINSARRSVFHRGNDVAEPNSVKEFVKQPPEKNDEQSSIQEKASKKALFKQIERLNMVVTGKSTGNKENATLGNQVQVLKSLVDTLESTTKQLELEEGEPFPQALNDRETKMEKKIEDKYKNAIYSLTLQNVKLKECRGEDGQGLDSSVGQSKTVGPVAQLDVQKDGRPASSVSQISNQAIIVGKTGHNLSFKHSTVHIHVIK